MILNLFLASCTLCFFPKMKGSDATALNKHSLLTGTNPHRSSTADDNLCEITTYIKKGVTAKADGQNQKKIAS